MPSNHHKLLGKHFYDRCPKFWVARWSPLCETKLFPAWMFSLNQKLMWERERYHGWRPFQRNSVAKPKIFLRRYFCRLDCATKFYSRSGYSAGFLMFHTFSRSKTRRQIGSKIGTTHGSALESLDSCNVGCLGSEHFPEFIERISEECELRSGRESLVPEQRQPRTKGKVEKRLRWMQNGRISASIEKKIIRNGKFVQWMYK